MCTVYVDKVVEVIKEIEVPREVIKEVILEVPVEVIKEKIVGYENWRFPDFSTGEVWMQLGALIAGVLLILAVEVVARRKGVDAE